MNPFRSLLLTTVGVVCLMLCGCASHQKEFGPASRPESGQTDQDRMLVRSVILKLDVADPAAAASVAEQAVRDAGGRVEKRTDERDDVALKLRVPAARLDIVTASLEALGKVAFRQSEFRDITGDFADTEARLKNAIALRDRLRELLGKTVVVADLLALEKELARVQADIDAFEARRAVMKDEVSLASVDCQLHRQKREPIPGPVTVVFKGLGWVLKKLFVLRD